MLQKRKEMPAVWSATPTPFTKSLQVDGGSLRRLIAHHRRLGVGGLFVAGTCGEGPFLTRRHYEDLIQTTAEANRGDLALAVQVTGNSSEQVRENARLAKRLGADYAVISEPLFYPPLSDSARQLERHFQRTVDLSPLPVGVYFRSAVMPPRRYAELLLHPKIRLVKDSSGSPALRDVIVAAQKRRPDLTVLTGDEFAVVDYLRRGYSGVLAGGAALVGYLLTQLAEAVGREDLGTAQRLQKRINRILCATYGGPKKGAWLAGLKYALVRLGVLSTPASLVSYPLTDRTKRAIDKMIEREKDVLLPAGRDA
ncbi:MAG TPA: dihydrodipicolinate synthase family protein [Sumerlaeia bacterium]|nr:dihydrodipicolinate synthase family protein [Sumerlaeia bacterium]